MRIGIDARMMGPENTRGLGRYIEELVRAMVEAAPENEYVLVTRTSDHALSGRVETVVADFPWYSWQEQTRMTRVLKDLKADVVHVPHWNVPRTYSGPLVTTIHDLLLRHQPASAKASTRVWPIRLAKRLGFRLVLDHAIGASRRICVPTEFTRQDLISFYPSAANKVIVTGEGITSLVARRIVASSQGRRARNAFAYAMRAGGTVGRWDDVVSGSLVAGRYLLYVGSAYPHKRLDLLLSAWKEISKQYPDMKLVIAGELDVFMKMQNEECRMKNVPKVTFLGKVTDDQLSGLYQNALALVFPSSFEGFGLTPLEALSHGCPVVSSDSTCLPEVLGKKGVVYFKSGSRDGMLTAVKTVVDNQGQLRQEAAEAGQELAQRHSWKQAAQKTLEAYHVAVLG